MRAHLVGIAQASRLFAQLPLKPTKKLKITVETKDANGSSSSSSENFVAEKDGKYVIPVPAAVK